MKTKIKNALKRFKNSRFLLAVVLFTIGFTTCYISIEAPKVYNYIQGGLKIVEASETRQDMDIVVPTAIYLDKVSNTGSVSSPEALTGNFSAYNAMVGQTDDDPFTMASNKQVYDGAIANNCLEYGTKVEVNGKIYTVEDRMNKRYGCNDFDIFMWEYQDAKQFGRRELEYKIQ